MPKMGIDGKVRSRSVELGELSGLGRRLCHDRNARRRRKIWQAANATNRPTPRINSLGDVQADEGSEGREKPLKPE